MLVVFKLISIYKWARSSLEGVSFQRTPSKWLGKFVPYSSLSFWSLNWPKVGKNKCNAVVVRRIIPVYCAETIAFIVLDRLLDVIAVPAVVLWTEMLKHRRKYGRLGIPIGQVYSVSLLLYRKCNKSLFYSFTTQSLFKTFFLNFRSFF